MLRKLNARLYSHPTVVIDRKKVILTLAVFLSEATLDPRPTHPPRTREAVDVGLSDAGKLGVFRAEKCTLAHPRRWVTGQCESGRPL